MYTDSLNAPSKSFFPKLYEQIIFKTYSENKLGLNMLPKLLCRQFFRMTNPNALVATFQ